MADTSLKIKMINYLDYGVIPVLVIDKPSCAQGVGEALVAAGLPVVELTLRTESSWNSYEELRKIKGLCVGVGSISSLEDMNKTIDLGAAFAVSPGLLPEIAELAIDAGMSYHPGVATPSEIMRGLDLGLKVLKFFPAEALGGMKTLNSMSAPFRELRFIPTGGIDLKILPDYLQSEKVAAVGGSWMVPQALVDAGEYEKIGQLTSQALETVRQTREVANVKY
jgi:2-dehydro-3-deoxyphosphogluconate aldolase/(4S)-4-hydroxy-2-oxoglutarate aldolase